ncbi:DUF6281 family protein [Streptomyces sp. NPDC047461]|uniref:DUF6281 family protein n=1 Tax=Streptomyces sp. NPDC047461 TaxID=3155619 RepID=UPI0033DE925B
MTITRGTLLVAAAVLLAATGCADGEAAASCSGLVTYDGRGYLPTAESGFTVGERLGTATVEACDDTGDGVDNASPGSRTGAYVVRGVDPAEAIAVGDGAAGTELVRVHR